MAVVLSAFQFTGGRLQGYRRDPEIDEVARKEYMRKNRRRPIDETVNQLGEGRGEFQEERSCGKWTLTYAVQESMRLDTQSGERRESRMRMASTCLVQEQSRWYVGAKVPVEASGGVYVCISLTEQIPRMKFDFFYVIAEGGTSVDVRTSPVTEL